jgi:predicted nucleic acid-binding Zn ribbon protein
MTETKPVTYSQLSSSGLVPAYQYECNEEGHYNASEKPLTMCKVARCGSALTRVGKGARS